MHFLTRYYLRHHLGELLWTGNHNASMIMIPHKKYNHEFRDEVKAIYDYHLLDLDTVACSSVRAKDGQGVTYLVTPFADAAKGRTLNLILYPDPKSLPKDRAKIVNEFVTSVYPVMAAYRSKMIAYPWIEE